MRNPDEKKKRVARYALSRFLEAGFQNVTMDGIAADLRMGKGTLYRYYPSKEELLLSSIELFAAEMQEKLERAVSDPKGSDVGRLGAFLSTVSGQLKRIRPEVLSEIARSVPEAYGKIEEIRSRIILKGLTDLLDKGKKNGVYRPETDPFLLANIVIGAVAHLTRPEILAKTGLTLDGLFQKLLSTVLLGCLTDEARRREGVFPAGWTGTNAQE